jgi:hypothetical protein
MHPLPGGQLPSMLDVQMLRILVLYSPHLILIYLSPQLVLLFLQLEQ